MALFTALAIGGAMSVGTAIATGAAVYGTAASLNASKRAMKAQKEATQVQLKQQRAQVQRQRRSSVRQSIMARARAANVAVGTGMAGSSAFLGGVSSLSSQVGANLGFGSMMSGLSQRITELSGTVTRAQGQAQMFGQIANLAMPFTDFGAALKGIQGFGSQGRANRAMDGHYARNQLI